MSSPACRESIRPPFLSPHTEQSSWQACLDVAVYVQMLCLCLPCLSLSSHPETVNLWSGNCSYCLLSRAGEWQSTPHPGFLDDGPHSSLSCLSFLPVGSSSFTPLVSFSLPSPNLPSFACPWPKRTPPAAVFPFRYKYACTCPRLRMCGFVRSRQAFKTLETPVS